VFVFLKVWKESFAIYEEHVSATEPYEMLSYSNVDDLIKTLPKKFVADYIKQKRKLALQREQFFRRQNSLKNITKKYIQAPRRISMLKIVLSRRSNFRSKPILRFFGKNKVSIINFQDNAMIGVVIEDAPSPA